MKRRGFFGALTGLIAAPIAAKAVEPADIVMTKHAQSHDWEVYCSMPVCSSISATWDTYDEEDER